MTTIIINIEIKFYIKILIYKKWSYTLTLPLVAPRPYRPPGISPSTLAPTLVTGHMGSPVNPGSPIS
jgi:hypothetical protein